MALGSIISSNIVRLEYGSHWSKYWKHQPFSFAHVVRTFFSGGGWLYLTGLDFLKDANFILKKIIQTELENKCRLICKNYQK
jgi:hypothetical protein